MGEPFDSTTETSASLVDEAELTDGHMTDTAVLLLNDELAITIALVWPQIPAEIRTGSSWIDICSEVSARVGLGWEDVSTKLCRMLHCGVIYSDGTLDRAAQRYIHGIATAKLAGVGAFDPERVAMKYLLDMSLEARIDWLTSHNLLD